MDRPMLNLPTIDIRDSECSEIADDMQVALCSIGINTRIVTVVMFNEKTGRPVPFTLKEKCFEYDLYNYHTVCLTYYDNQPIIIDYGNPDEQFYFNDFLHYLRKLNDRTIGPDTRIAVFCGHYDGDGHYLPSPTTYLERKEILCIN